MPAIEDAVIQRALAAEGVQEILGDRLWPGLRPQASSLPGAVFNLITYLPGLDHDGPSTLAQARVQFDVYAATYGEAQLAAQALRAALHGFKGEVETEVGTVTVRGAWQDAERRILDDEAPEPLSGRSLDFIIWANEPAISEGS